MSYPVKNGQTSVVLRFKLLDSSSTTGAGLTGLTSASSGLIISTIADNESSATAYTQAGSTIETISTLGTYAAPTATKCRFKEVDSTNHKGVYEIQLADARFAVSNAKSLLVSVSGATNLAQADFVVPLVSDDPYVAKLTASGIASAVWQDTTAGDFTVSASVGKSIMNGVSLGTGLTVASVSGSVGSVTSAVTAGTVSDKTGYSLTSAYDAAKTASQAGDVMKVSSGTGANQISLSSGAVTVGTNNDKTGYTVSTVSDKTGYALTSAYDPAKTASQAGDAMALTAGAVTSIWAALTSTLTTVGSIGKLLVDNIDAAISSRSTYAGGDTSGTTTLLSRLTSGRASNIDNLDATVTSRLAAVDYTTPDNADIAAIKAKTDNLPSDPADASDIAASLSIISSAIAALPTTSTVMQANIKKVNDIDVTGDGSATAWGPA